MRGQLCIEFLLVILATLVMLSAMAGAMLSQRESAERRADEFMRINEAEGVARAVEAGLHGAGSLSSGPFGIGYRIEAGALHSSSGGEAIEVRGVFIADPDEPV